MSEEQRKILNMFANISKQNPEFIQELSENEYKEMILNTELRLKDKDLNNINILVISDPETFMEIVENNATDHDYKVFKLFGDVNYTLYSDRLGYLTCTDKNMNLNKPSGLFYQVNGENPYGLKGDSLVIFSPQREKNSQCDSYKEFVLNKERAMRKENISKTFAYSLGR